MLHWKAILPGGTGVTVTKLVDLDNGSNWFWKWQSDAGPCPVTPCGQVAVYSRPHARTGVRVRSAAGITRAGTMVVRSPTPKD